MAPKYSKSLKKATPKCILSELTRPWPKNPDVIAASCPFCTLMLTDGVKNRDKEDQVKVMDVAELIAEAQDL